jgi:hypothetical protein
MPIKQPFLALLLVFLCGLFIPLHGQQNTYLHIRQADDKPVPYAKINGSLRASENGMFIWNKAAYPQITISAWNFADTTLIAADYIGVDTAYIYLRPQPEQLNEVLVNPKNRWLQNYIYGFERWQNGWLFLLQNEIYITNNTLDILYKSPIPKPEKRTPRELYTDVLGNTYLLGKDSVQQLFVTDSSLYVYPAKSKIQFYHLIKALLAETEEGLVYRETKETDYEVDYLVRETGSYLEFAIQHPHLHNCGADIYLKNGDTNRVLIRSIDKELYLEASIAFGAYAQFYMLWWREFEITGSWLNKYFEPKDMAKNTYRAVHGNYKQLYFLPLNNEFLFIDRFGGRLVRFSNDLATLTEEPYGFDDCPPEEYLHTDGTTRKWWLQRRVRGLDQLESIRPGDPPKTIILDPFVRNIRVHNNVVFYITERDQFRVKKID